MSAGEGVSQEEEWCAGLSPTENLLLRRAVGNVFR